ncbi:MAG: PD-(D/E)XK nuclease family protein [Kiritimatiellae bacterium]|nr:PD-(D/E)XK nuclease family protein [Kiritimatiellia bacterium]
MFDGLKITFGMGIDGARRSGGTSVGEITCGPLGMLKFLETRYALNGKAISDFERIDAYARKIDAANCEWCRDSFAVDPWSTAGTLLSWRDELVTLGWDFKRTGESVRFAALAKIEAAGPNLPMGMADRLARIVAEAKRKLPHALILVDAYEDLPLIWRKIFCACFDGWHVLQPEVKQEMPQVTVIKGVNDIALSRDVARYLSAGGEERIAVISEGDTQVLDAELRRFGLPTFGVSDPSRERKAIQALIGALSEYGRTRGDEFAVADLIAVLESVSSELRKDIERNPISKLAASHVSALRAQLVDKTTIRRSALWRMVQMIVGEGARCPYSVHELGEVSFLRSPAEMVDEVDVALWSPFVPTGRSSGLICRKEEKDVLGITEAGKLLIDDERARQNARELKSWERCLSLIRGQLVLFVPDRISGDAAGVHPLYDMLLKKAGKEAKDLEMCNSDLIVDGVWSLAGRSIKLKNATAHRPKFADEYRIEPDSGLAPRSLSPTQLESLLSCPFQWYHKYHLGLVPSEAAKSETTKTRQGNMAHRMVEELVKGGTASVADVTERFSAIFESLCDGVIPEFAEPDRKLERESFKAQLLSSVKTLWRLMEERGLRPVASEFEFLKKDFCGVPFTGKADLILEDADGRRHIFDFKWSTRKDYAEKVKEGTSVQLAAYDWLGGFGAKSGYYLFPNEKFVENIQDNAKVWERAQTTYQKRISDMRSGLLSKAIDIGLDGYLSAEKKTLRQQAAKAQGLEIDVHAGCRYCDYKALCGKLWEEGGAE